MLVALTELVTLRFLPTDIPLIASCCLAVFATAHLGELGTDFISCYCIRFPVDPRLICVFRKLSRRTSWRAAFPSFALFSKLGAWPSTGLNSLIMAGPMEVWRMIAGWPGVAPVRSEPIICALSLLLPHSMPLRTRGDVTWLLFTCLRAFSMGAVCMW